MDPNLAELIRAVSTDAIKILGPAVIAGWFTFKATSAQHAAKLKELEKTHGFSARQSLFDYYKQQELKIAENQNKLSSGLTQILGFATALDADPDEETKRVIRSFTGLVTVYLATLPFDIGLIIRDLRKGGLSDSEEFERLKGYEQLASKVEVSEGLEDLQQLVYSLLEMYSFMGRCTLMLLKHEMDQLYKGYVESDA